MKTAIITIIILAVLGAGIYVLLSGENEVVPSGLPTQTVSPAVSVSPSPSVSPVSTPFTSANVRVSAPLPNSVVTSPLTVRGEARGNWFFEANLPLQIRDANGRVVANGYAMTASDWMTTNFVPFTGTITFTAPSTNTGTLVIMKDNPSGLPQNDAEVSFPIRFR